MERRCQLARHCRDKLHRHLWTGKGCAWRAFQVPNAATDLPYGDQAAWGLIADSLEDPGTTITELVLQQPLGALSYWWIITQPSGLRIYVKIQIGADGNSVIGRSFHISEF